MRTGTAFLRFTLQQQNKCTITTVMTIFSKIRADIYFNERTNIQLKLQNKI